MNRPKFPDALLTPFNAVILGSTIIISALYFSWYGSFTKPAIFGAIILIFSVFYSMLFTEKPSQELLDEIEMRKLANEKNDNLTPIIEKIITSLKSIKQKSKSNSKFLIITKFMDEISNFEEIIPKLIRNYRNGMAFIREHKCQVETEIKNLKYKHSSSSGAAKETYLKTLQEKEQTMLEMKDIQNGLDECESKLHYIYSTLQKIETIVASSEFDDAMTEQDAQDISQQLDVFSSSIKDVVKIMKI